MSYGGVVSCIAEIWREAGRLLHCLRLHEFSLDTEFFWKLIVKAEHFSL